MNKAILKQIENGLPEMEISGDRFLMGIPSQEMAWKLSDMPDIEREDSFLYKNNYVTAVCQADQLFHRVGFCYVTKGSDEISWLPILIPMDKAGNIDQTFAITCPDMFPLYGGCLRCEKDNGEVLYFGDHPDDFTPQLPDESYKSVQMVECEQAMPIRWLALDGVLIAKAPVFRATITQLRTLGLL